MKKLNFKSFAIVFPLTILTPTLCVSGMSDAELYNLSLKNMAHIKAEGLVGTGFFVKDEGATYLYTCEHCIASTNSIEVTRVDGRKVKLLGLELAPGRDLVRFKVDVKGGLGLVTLDDLAFGSEVVAYGDSLGDGVMTASKGSILGVGAKRIEVDAVVVKGNSGGPILTRDGKAAGAISTRITSTDQESKGTRYEKPRMIAESLLGIDWETCSYEQYRSDYGRIRDMVIMVAVIKKCSAKEYWDWFDKGVQPDLIQMKDFPPAGDVSPKMYQQFKSMAKILEMQHKAAADLWRIAGLNCTVALELVEGTRQFPFTIDNVEFKDKLSWTKYIEDKQQTAAGIWAWFGSGWCKGMNTELNRILTELGKMKYSYNGTREAMIEHVKTTVIPMLKDIPSLPEPDTKPQEKPVRK